MSGNYHHAEKLRFIGILAYPKRNHMHLKYPIIDNYTVYKDTKVQYKGLIIVIIFIWILFTIIWRYSLFLQRISIITPLWLTPIHYLD